MEDFALLPEMPNPLKDILARLVARAHAEGHAVVWRGHFRKEAVKGREVVENLRHAVEDWEPAGRCRASRP